MAFKKSRSGTLASTMIIRSPGRRTIRSGFKSPDWACSLKSQCALMPAASTTRRNVSSPQRPRAWLELSTRRSCSVSLESDWLCVANVSSCFLTSPNVVDWVRFRLLEALLIRFQLLFQRLDQCGNGLLALGQITFGGFLKLAQSLVGQTKKFRLGLLRASALKGFEGVAQINAVAFSWAVFASRSACSWTCSVRQELLRGGTLRFCGGAGEFNLTDCSRSRREFVSRWNSRWR